MDPSLTSASHPSRNDPIFSSLRQAKKNDSAVKCICVIILIRIISLSMLTRSRSCYFRGPDLSYLNVEGCCECEGLERNVEDVAPRRGEGHCGVGFIRAFDCWILVRSSSDGQFSVGTSQLASAVQLVSTSRSPSEIFKIEPRPRDPWDRTLGPSDLLRFEISAHRFGDACRIHRRLFDSRRIWHRTTETRRDGTAEPQNHGNTGPRKHRCHGGHRGHGTSHGERCRRQPCGSPARDEWSLHRRPPLAGFATIASSHESWLAQAS